MKLKIKETGKHACQREADEGYVLTVDGKLKARYETSKDAAAKAQTEAAFPGD